MSVLDKKKLNDGVEIPMLGLGTGKLQGDICKKTIENAIKMGYRHIDTAHIYENHEQIGSAISGFPREDIFITSKLWCDSHDPALVETACNKSLKELGLSHIDLYLVHWPQHKKQLIDIIDKMFRLKEKGKIRSVGVSNATAHHIDDILNAGFNISMNQFEIHPFFSQKELVKFCKDRSIEVTSYKSFARGSVSESKPLTDLAKKKSKTIHQIVLRWLHQRDLIIIPKASTTEHLKENLEIDSFSLDKDEMTIIDNLNVDKRLTMSDEAEFDY